jgi:hypothetical protein
MGREKNFLNGKRSSSTQRSASLALTNEYKSDGDIERPTTKRRQKETCSVEKAPKTFICSVLHWACTSIGLNEAFKGMTIL